MDNSEKRVTQGTQEEDKQNKTKIRHNMCWTPLCQSKNKQRTYEMPLLQTTWRKDEPNIGFMRKL